MQNPPLPSPDLNDDELAVALAQGAGEVLLSLREQAATDIKAGAPYEPKKLKDAGDAASQQWLAAALSNARPNDAVLSEEAADNPARLISERVWIIDPLDGTREFSEWDADTDQWRDDFAVHIALWQRDKGLTHGAVGLPARDQIFSSASVQAPTATVATDAPVRVAASRTRPPAFIADLADAGHIALVPMGSAGVKVISVVEGTTDAYLHGGGQYEWDSAAPVAVAQAAGLVATKLDGSPLTYNNENPWSPDLFVTRPDIAPRVRALVDASA